MEGRVNGWSNGRNDINCEEDDDLRNNINVSSVVEDADSDSDSAPESVSFQKGHEFFENSDKLRLKQIEKVENFKKENRKKRDEVLKEQKAAKLKRLQESKLSTDFLEKLTSLAHSEVPTGSQSEEPLSISAPDESLLAKKREKRKLIPLPDVDGVEFEVVVGRSRADEEVMRKTENFIKGKIKHPSKPRLCQTRKQSLKMKRRFVAKTR